MILTANDLMLGDYVRCVKCYGSPKSEIMCIDSLDIDRIASDSYMVEGVELTREYLIDNGFECRQEKGHNVYTYKEICNTITLAEKDNQYTWVAPITIESVHELQHLMRFCKFTKQLGQPKEMPIVFTKVETTEYREKLRVKIYSRPLHYNKYFAYHSEKPLSTYEVINRDVENNQFVYDLARKLLHSGHHEFSICDMLGGAILGISCSHGKTYGTATLIKWNDKDSWGEYCKKHPDVSTTIKNFTTLNQSYRTEK